MPVCYIIAAGDCEKISVNKNENDLIIAADGGLKYCERDGIKPDIIIGDFDSSYQIPTGNNVMVFPVKKDDTDTLLAIKEAIRLGYNRIIISGGVGGELDHLIANIQSLIFASEKKVNA